MGKYQFGACTHCTGDLSWSPLDEDWKCLQCGRFKTPRIYDHVKEKGAKGFRDGRLRGEVWQLSSRD